MSAPVDVLAVMDDLIADMGGETPGTTGHQVAQARAAVAELVEDVAPLLASLQSRITSDNAMTPQAVMVRRAADSLARVKGAAA